MPKSLTSDDDHTVSIPKALKQYPNDALHVRQSIYPNSPDVGPIAYTYREDDLTEEILNDFLSTVKDGRIGLAPAYSRRHQLASLAFSSNDEVMVVKFSSRTYSYQSFRKELETHILLNPSYTKYAFYMDKLCTALCDRYDIGINQGIDILSCLRGERHLNSTKVISLGGEPDVDYKAVAQLFHREEAWEFCPVNIATRAWAAYRTTLVNPRPEAKLIDTTVYCRWELSFLARAIRDAEVTKSMRPEFMKNEIEDDHQLRKGQLTVKSSRYKTRIMRPGAGQVYKVEINEDGRQRIFDGHLARLKGKTVQFDIPGAKKADTVTIYTVGREDPRCAETSRSAITRNILQNTGSGVGFFQIPLVRDLWIPSDIPTHKLPTFSTPIDLDFNHYSLNTSQESAVQAILSNKGKDRLVLIQGPPGTGKTTVITAAVLSIMNSEDTSRTIWLVAQSNVAVKNIAEKLAGVDFFDFKLLVSKEFHFDWHEHLYSKIPRNIVRSDNISPDISVETLLEGSRIILCTLSMLSHPYISIIARSVPPTLMIFDEASQIEVGDYIPIISSFRDTISKLVFIGDPKQLSPYGQNLHTDLRSIFELGHQDIFLDVQYRMPHAIGSVISRLVYNGRLNTEHEVIGHSCLRFIDVDHGQEKPTGFSSTNEQEARIVTSLSKNMESMGHSFRVITPYDAQRALLESSLKNAGLEWENKVFNVDSFQGNEEDYIIVSLVRTDRIGFLKDQRRANVMLSRCKKGMVICTKRSFLKNVASDSIVSVIANEYPEDEVWLGWKSVLQPGFRLFS